jgi:hypothetical protein
MVSLMNGLSALGQGVSAFAGSAALEVQKADLAKQSLVLADQLATARETGLQASGGVIAAAAADKAQAATLALETQREGADLTRTNVTEAGANTRSANTIAAENQRATNTLNQPPEAIRTLQLLGVPIPGITPPGGGSAPAAGVSGGAASGSGSAPLPGPRATGGTAADGSVVPQSGGGSTPDPSATGTSTPTPSGSGTSTPGPSASGTASGASTPAPDPMDNALVRKILGYPAAGSEDALRRAVATDVKNDPAFKYQTAGQQATETELRVNVAKGAMTSPETQLANATLIAGYQIKPPDGYALSRPGAAETMALVGKLNPDYQEGRFPEVNKAMTAFGTGPQGNTIRSLNVGVQHLAVLDQAGQALGNGDVQALNGLKNMFQQQFGAAAPTTFDALKQIVGTEVEKAVAGGIGTGADRDRIMQSLKSANSPAQLQAVTNGFRDLMVGQLNGLKTQYEDATGFKDGRFAFETKLSPETTKALQLNSGAAAALGAQPDTRNTPMTPQQMYGGSAAPVAAPVRQAATPSQPPLPPGFRVVQ